jgi:hypothetical protein
MIFSSYLKVTLATMLTIVLFAATLRRYVWLPSYLTCPLATTFNMMLNALTLGGYVWLEGGVHGDVFSNWIKHFRYNPQRFFRPTTEQEIVKQVGDSRSLRVFGAGHSFNAGIVSDETLVSLDDYSGLITKDMG